VERQLKSEQAQDENVEKLIKLTDGRLPRQRERLIRYARVMKVGFTA
jgi:hypothetical protein